MANQAQQSEIGMVGLGVMGRNLLLNMADHGFAVSGYDKDPAKVAALQKEANSPTVVAASDLETFIGSLRAPRAIMLLVPAGPPVDAVINDLLPHLQPGDLIIDGGNSYFKDTDVRARHLTEKGIHFLGVGVSGGEAGARRGPSIMPGGPQEAYERVRPVLEAVAAKADGEPCVTWLGPGSSGHFVKMVHNGIEYGIMQLISESYDLMKRGLELSDDELGDVYASWNRGELNGYLMEITSEIFRRKDEATGKPLVDLILDVASQKGTGMWTSQGAMELQVPIPTIDLAVAMRDMSSIPDQRARAAPLLPRYITAVKTERDLHVTQIGRALYAGIALTYAQGMALLVTASAQYGYQLKLENVARIWRGGCIIRSRLLEDIAIAYGTKPDLPNLLLDAHFSAQVMAHQECLRRVVCLAAENGIPAPGFMVSLGYLDAYRSVWLPANLIQAQRDFFGSHTYARNDTKGTFHTQWVKD